MENYSAPTNKKNLARYDDALKVNKLAREYGQKSNEVKAAIKEYGFGSYYEARSVITRSKLGDIIDITVITMAIGDVAFVFAPYEMFGCHGNYIKDNSPYENTFIVTNVNRPFGYMAASEAFDYNSYEAAICRFEQGTGEILCDKYLEMLREMATRE